MGQSSEAERQIEGNEVDPISETTWQSLVKCSQTPAVAAWASRGVFSTAVGPAFFPGTADGLFYVGKAGGPRIDAVGIAEDQAAGSAAGVRWMLERRNPSAFWTFADLLVPRREHLAWSNLAKIDTRLATPPSRREWRQIRESCLSALKEEMQALRPRRTVFVTGGYCTADILALLELLGFARFEPGLHLEETIGLRSQSGQLVVITRHPQGWRAEVRNRVAQFVRGWQG